ncbi:pyridoxal phosphate-dependent aminotransferase [Microvirga antarctica]|uniref:pyridoxal phosphate-dependent aminotransferase n=1 Tax=Microvirga antarctica TaxID=2819233 RepID=UPI001B30CA4B|nr:aminotransferase class I/II-fold pyridoxal phosphate-dependent enzyme [Microvirga antarctica]
MSTFADIQKLDGAKLRYALMDLAKEVPDAIALGRGDPDLPTPAFIVEAARKAAAGPLAVAPLAGLPALRDAIARNAARDHGIAVGSDNVLVTTGGQEGLFLVMSALLDPGDEILVPDPRYSSYDQAISHTGATFVSVPTFAEEGFDIRPEEVERRITPKTRALLLVTPSNPTGGIIRPETALALAELAKRHNFVIVSDEIYGKFVWEPYRHFSIASLPGMLDHVITLSGFSKAYAMTGWRVGYVIAPERMIAAMTDIKAHTTGPVATLSQVAALAAAEGDDSCVRDFRAIYDERRRILGSGLSAMGLQFGEPRGGFFFWADSSSTGMRALELCYLLLKEARVLIFPGTAFGESWSNHLRITTLQPTEVLDQAAERMKAALAQIREAGAA